MADVLVSAVKGGSRACDDHYSITSRTSLGRVICARCRRGVRTESAPSVSFGSTRSIVLGKEAKLGRRGTPYKRNLYAIVIPAGGGKSTMSTLFGQLDIDEVLDRDIENKLRKLRVTVFREPPSRRAKIWEDHNAQWYSALATAFEACVFEEPTFLFCHTKEVADHCGAETVLIMVPEEAVHASNLQGREPDDFKMAIANVETIFKESRHSPLLRRYRTNDAAMRMVASQIAELTSAPGISKVLGREDALSRPGFRREVPPTVPDQILRGEPTYDSIDYILPQVAKGIWPGWMLTRWLQFWGVEETVQKKTSCGMLEWTRLASRLGKGKDKATITLANFSKLDLLEVFPDSMSMYNARANVRLRDLRPAILRAPDHVRNLCLRLLNIHLGAEHNFVTSLVSYVLGIVSKVRGEVYNAIVCSGMLEVKHESWVAEHTAIHNLVRGRSELFGCALSDREATELQYTYSLIGRTIYAPDPEAEIVKRSRDTLTSKQALGFGYSIEEYWRIWKDGIEIAVSKLGGKPGPWSNFDEFFAQRYEWAAGGSVTNLPSDMRYLKEVADVVVGIKGTMLALRNDPNKKMLMERLQSPAQLAMFIGRHWGYNDSTTAAKPNEAAKNRVLIPGSFLHYVVTTYILGMVERSGPIGTARLGDFDDIAFYNFDVMLAASASCFMLDFADHNAQHSPAELKYIMEVMEGAMVNSGGDMVEASSLVAWVVDSFSQMRIIGADGEAQPIVSGLYSGWRSTTWINTLAAHGYLHVGIVISVRVDGDSGVIDLETCGDDVQSVELTPTQSYKLYLCMMRAGFEMKSLKQMFRMGTREFLRKLYSEHGVFGSINRLLPNFVCGDLERSNPTGIARVGGAYATCQTLIRRGLDPEAAQVMFEAFVKKWLRAKIDGVYYEIPLFVVHARPEDGGLGVPDCHGYTWVLNKPPPKPVPVTIARAADLPSSASEDYAALRRDELMRIGATSVDVQTIIDKLLKDTYVKGSFDSEHYSSPEWRAYIKSGVKVVQFIKWAKEVNVVLLTDALQTCDEQGLTAFKSSYYQYVTLSGDVMSSDLDLIDIQRACGVASTIDLAVSLKIEAGLAFLVPEYVLNNLAWVLRYWVYLGKISLGEVNQCFADMAETYNAYFVNTV